MCKRYLAAALSLVLVLCSVSFMAFAEETDLTENFLKEGHTGLAGNDFTSLGDWEMNNPLGLSWDLKDPYADFSFWHFVDSSCEASYAVVSFRTPAGEDVSWTVSPGKNAQHYSVITPSGWELTGGVSYSAAAGQFNLSHSGCHRAELGIICATADISGFYYETTPHLYYERTVDRFYERPVDAYYERDVDRFYERTVDEFYTRAVDEFYERDVSELYQRYAQRYLVPVFERRIGGSYYKTLVTRLTYSDNTANAKPVNGGAFKNGHTYVNVDVAAASGENGVWFRIADSSKNNGKKTPDAYNIPVGYCYNVRIADGKLTVTLPKNMAFAQVGAFVYASAPKDAKNAPKHYNGSVTVDLPADCGDTVYLYTHFESLGWYEADADGNCVYQFKSWEYDESRTERGNYELTDTVYGDYELVRTEYGEYVLADTVYGGYELAGTIYGDYGLARTEYGEYVLVSTLYGDYELVDTHNESRVVDVPYTGNVRLTVDGVPQPLNTDLELTPGEHTFVLTGDGFEPVTKAVNVRSGINMPVSFRVRYELEGVILPAVGHYDDKLPSDCFSDLEAADHFADRDPHDHYTDKPADAHYADLNAVRYESDRETVKVYNGEYLYREDIYLGDEKDPFGEYAVRLN